MEIISSFWAIILAIFGFSASIYLIGRCWKSGWNIAKACVDAIEAVLTAIPALITAGIQHLLHK